MERIKVRFSSHKVAGRVKKILPDLRTYSDMTGPGQSVADVTPDEYEQIKSIKGVTKKRQQRGRL